jgi:hypothetical protein
MVRENKMANDPNQFFKNMNPSQQAAALSTLQSFGSDTGAQAGAGISGMRPMARPGSVGGTGVMSGIWDKMGGLDGLGSMAGVVGDLGGIYAGLKSLGIAEDQLKFQKDSYNTNLKNQTQSYNTALEGRTRARHKAERVAPGQTDSYLAENKL